MKKSYRLLAAAAAVFLTLQPCGSRAAEQVQFTYSGITAPASVSHNVDSSFRHNGTGTKAVHYYGYSRSPVKYSDDLFSEGYNYMCYGTGKYSGEYSWNNMSVTFPNNLDGLEAGDALYFSFYYRSAPEFDGADGSGSYTGQETTPSLRFNAKTTGMYELASGKISGSAETSPFMPDGMWHKAEYYVPVSSSDAAAANMSFWICFMQMQNACSIDLAGFSYGVLKTGDITPSNEAYYTLIGWELNKASLTSLTVDGQNVALSKGVTEYTADADSIDAVITAGGCGKDPEIEKKDDFTYEITAYAVGYDALVDEELQYVQRTSPDGEFDRNGTDEVYTIVNADRKNTYTLHLNVKPAQMELLINGQNKYELDGCADGDIVEIKEIYNNFTERGRTFMTLLVFYRDGGLFSIVPYKTELAASELNRRESFSYILDFEDYSGVTCDVMIMDTESYNEVLK